MLFLVKRGHVQLKDWRLQEYQEKLLLVKEEMRKNQTCWFHENHPDGCSLETKECLYAHGTDD